MSSKTAVPFQVILESTTHIVLLSTVTLLGICVPASPAENVAAVAPGETRTGMPLFNVRQHGAVGDGRHLDTAAIQAAIDACTGDGGGTVFIPPGKYLAGTLFLKSNVRLDLRHPRTSRGRDNAE